MTKEKKSGKGKIIGIIIVVIVLIVAIGSCSSNDDSTTTSSDSNNQSSTQEQTTENKDAAKITMAEFEQIQNGMTYDQVVSIIGSEGTLQSETNISDDPAYLTQLYSWEGVGDLGANANVTIQGGTVVSKSQFGLK